MCSQTDGVSAMASMTSGVKSCGCGLVNRTRRIPSTAPTCRRRWANSGVREDPGTVTSRPYVFTFWPSRVTSTTPGRRAPGPRPRCRRRSGNAAAPARAARCRTCRRCRTPARSRPTRGTRHRGPPGALGNVSVCSRTSIWGPSVSERSNRSRRCGSAWVPTTTSTQGRTTLDLALVLLGEAPADDDPHLGVGRLQRLQMAEVAVELVVGVLADRARVEHHHARVGESVGRGHAVGEEQPGDALRVVLVHPGTRRCGSHTCPPRPHEGSRCHRPATQIARDPRPPLKPASPPPMWGRNDDRARHSR